MSARTDSEDAGFTLVEVLVALVVSALLLVIIFNGATLARARQAQTKQSVSASLLAQSLYAKSASAPNVVSIENGRSSSFEWQVEQTVLARDPRGFFALAAIKVQVKNADGRTLSKFSGRRVKRLVP